MDVTDEMRKAVYLADCQSYGHMPDFGDVASGSDLPNPNDPRGFPMTVVRARDAKKLPHIRCLRCGAVWLVIDEPGAGYDDAVSKVAARMSPVRAGRTAALAPQPVEGVGETPIPLADGVSWEALPEDHPALLHARQMEEHDRVHFADGQDAPGPMVEPDPTAKQPQPGAVEVITTTAPETTT